MIDVTYEKMAGAVGSLLLVWAEVERSVRDEIKPIHKKKAHGIAAAFDAWRDAVIASQPAKSLCPLLAIAIRTQLQGPLDIRNGICHGLRGISTATEKRPAMLSWEINGKGHSISWEALQASLSWLSKINRAVWIVSNHSSDHAGNRLEDNAENREWWRAEFGINLPDE